MDQFTKIAFTSSFTRAIANVASRISPAIKSFVTTKALPMLGTGLGVSAIENLADNLYNKKELSGYKVVDNALTNALIFGGLAAGAAGIGAGYSKLRSLINPSYLKNIAAAKTKAIARNAKELLKLRSKPGGADYLKKMINNKAIGSSPSYKFIGMPIGAYLNYDPENPISSIVGGTAKGALGGAIAGMPLGKLDTSTFSGALKEGIKSMIPFTMAFKEYENKQVRDRQRLIKEYYQRLQSRSHQ